MRSGKDSEYEWARLFAIDYAEHGNTGIKKDVDATKQEIDKRIDGKSFSAWLENLFAGLAEVKEVNVPTASKGQTDSGKVYGWTVGGKIFLTKDGINPNTPIHEYTHLWAEAMRQRNAKGWQSVKDLLKQRPCLGIR